ncbi:hypothetical protein NMO89_001808 [Salmonella enterica]|uniref:Uncharacterized protein n=2 Tax=Salmonella houtenae TaxID=59205 RepID=A0A736I1U2_SALHO|nr:hypothetical protein [Salmonella enterica]ECC1641030.1 hypothetical protein [Salmonella enterica subsp. houtenae]EHM8757321.1 hypothetical protein [Salmonella enterica subsp. houtenae serovar 44:z36,[z38]:-]MBA2164662.1 hypothetical protein [Salmonella enterica subsp. houtenae serovar 18:z36,z38:-]HAE7579109.1 hypothetical protein [Salmonella enterica subsp. houtenae serovar 44:z36[z38]:-]HCM1939493.1 hypothetical protein [Salmonella enterica subsp. houtenae serovar 57:z4,z23:-]HCM1966767.
MEIDEQEQIVTEQLQELALQEIEGVAAGLIIAGEYLDHILHKDDAASLEKQKAMSSTLACFALFAGRDIMRSLGEFR